MNLHITAPPPGAGSREALSPSVRIGMPHLSLTGLSENWLLKECGHRHWFLLAAAAGDSVPDFRDAAGDQVYAVFRAVAIRDARFERVAENDELHFISSLSRISRTQFTSVHHLIRGGGKVGEVELISSFVKRTNPEVNRSVARVNLEAFPFAGQATQSALADLAGPFWSDSWSSHRGFQREQAGLSGSLIVRPNPSIDFNGARFLYFASFPALADRAEWDILSPPPHLTTVGREVFYYGNIEPGDEIVIRIGATAASGTDLIHWCALHRRCDDARLADIFTTRRAV
ncbi:MAG: hypothetical protein EKK40_14425 [Bradyrhizobiaceae bacterium]|nr:MAG: hypothetical protein EKK40_14425 [Bradyrhizobiaceae bacterium]